jgi:hypothetical protein
MVSKKQSEPKGQPRGHVKSKEAEKIKHGHSKDDKTGTPKGKNRANAGEVCAGSAKFINQIHDLLHGACAGRINSESTHQKSRRPLRLAPTPRPCCETASR